MPNGQRGLAPGLSGFRAQRQDKMQRQQHGMQMAQARQGMQETAQQMRQRRERIERMKMENEEFKKNEELRQIKREAQEEEARLAEMSARDQIENFDQDVARERLNERLENAHLQVQTDVARGRAQLQDMEIQRNAHEYLANRLPSDPSKITPRTVRQIRRGLEDIGQDPDEMGIPTADNFSDSDRASLHQMRNNAINNVEHERNLDMQLASQQAQQAPELIQLQERRSQLQSRLDQMSRDDPQYDQVNQQIAEISSKINEIRLPTDLSEAAADQFPGWVGDSAQGEIAGQISDGVMAVDWMNDIQQYIKEDPTRAGLVGSARNLYQRTRGIAGDLSTVFTPQGQQKARSIIDQTAEQYQNDAVNGEVEEGVRDAGYFDPTLPEIQQFENAMAYRLASMHKQGRLARDDIERFRNQIQVTGWTDANTAYERIQGVKERTLQRLDALERRRSGRSLPYEGQPDTIYSSEEGEYGPPDREEGPFGGSGGAYGSRVQQSDEQLVTDQMRDTMGSLAQSRFDSEVKEVIPNDGDMFARLEDDRVMNTEGVIVDDPSYPDAIRNIGVRNVRRKIENTETGEVYYELIEGTLLDEEGNPVQIED